MKTIMGLKTNGKSCMQGLANKTTDGDCGLLANTMNDFFVSVSDHLPRLNKSHKVFDVNEELPDQYVISVCTTCKALESVKANKATGPDNIPAWVLRNYANVLTPPLTAIFNNSLREGVLPMKWKMANVIPLPKTSPPVSIEKDIRPISLTPIAAKVFESIIMKWVDETIEGEIDAKQFGGISGTSTTDVLVELVHMWYKATDKLNSYVRVVMLDFSKAFDLINHHLLLDKLQSYGLPAHILRWMATFLLDRAQRVKIGNEYSHSGHPNGGVPQGTLSGPKCFLVYINDLRTTVPLYKYVDDSTLFEICDRNDVSVIQESVDIAARWTEQNDIKINSEKSKEIIISFAQDGNFRSTIPNIKIDGRDIAHVCHAKLLGVTISQDLTWNVSGCGKTWLETTEEGFTFQCLGCWQVDCLTAELARLTDIVKRMQSGGRVIARTTNGERTTGNMTCRKVTGEKVTVEKEGGTRGQEMREVDATGGKTNGRKEVRGDVTKRKSITRTMTGKKETGKKGTTEKAAGGKVSNQEDTKRRSYSEAVIEGALRT